MTREEYPGNWTQGVIDTLEKHPRWTGYGYSDLDSSDMFTELRLAAQHQLVHGPSPCENRSEMPFSALMRTS